jgi:hypothetical protein
MDLYTKKLTATLPNESRILARIYVLVDKSQLAQVECRVGVLENLFSK